MQRHQEYANELVKKHGEEKAVKIVTENLAIANREPVLTFFDEAEFTINDHGRYEFSKTQGKKVTKIKDKRVKGNRNFFALVLQLLTKGKKNESKN